MATGAAPPDLPAVDGAVRAATWIVMPAYQEEAVVGEVVAALRRRYPHVVVVDDGSADSTAAAAAAAGARVVRHAINRGQGAALQTGIEHALTAGARYLVTFDSDGQHQAEDVDRLLAPLVAGEAEFCLGSRFLDAAATVPPGRRLLLRCALLFTRWTSGARVTDTHNGFRAMTRRAAATLDLTLDRMAHASELIDQVHASGLPYTERSVTVRYTAYSRRKGQRAGAALRIALDYLLGRLR